MKTVSVLALASIAGMASAQAVSVGNGIATNLGNDPFSNRSTLWDNGDTDGSNGYSQGTVNAFGTRRSTMDDFEVTDSAGWILNDFHTIGLMSSGAGGGATGYQLNIWSDNAGSPDAPIASANVTSFTESLTGRTWFSRPELAYDVEFDDIALAAGRYWVEMTIVAPENHFQMVRAGVTGSEMWVNYDDLGFGPGSTVFGVPADVAFSLTGEVAPAPGALALLGLGGMAAIRRRR